MVGHQNMIALTKRVGVSWALARAPRVGERLDAHDYSAELPGSGNETGCICSTAFEVPGPLGQPPAGTALSRCLWSASMPCLHIVASSFQLIIRNDAL